MLTVTLGPLTMALNHLLMLTALVIASVVGWWVARRGGESPESALFNLFLIGVLCARLGFVVAYWPMYQDDLVQVIDIRDGGFLFWSGLAGIVLAALWQGWRQPGLRRPLGWALFSGALFWGLSSLGSHLYSKGTELPELSLRNAGGQPVALHSYRGKPLVINIWATWCPPCRREMPVLQQAQGQPERAARATAEARLAHLDAPGALERFKAAQQLARGRPGAEHIELSILDARVRDTERLVREQLREAEAR